MRSVISHAVKYQDGPEGRKIVVELRRKQGVPQSFMRTLAKWLRGEG